MPNFDINSHFIKEANFSQVKFGEDGYVLEVELNEMQQIQREKLKAVTKETLGDYGIFCEGQYQFENGKLNILGERVLIDGEIVKIENASLSDLTENSNVYIVSWDEEVNHTSTLTKDGYTGGSSVPNKIKDQRVGVETSRRYVAKFTLSKTLDSSKKNLLIGKIVEGKLLVSDDLVCVGDKPVTHTSTGGKPISLINLGGNIITKPQFNTQSNFNFIGNKVVQDGLVDFNGKFDNKLTNKVLNITTDDFHIIIKYEKIIGTGYLFSINTYGFSVHETLSSLQYTKDFKGVGQHVSYLNVRNTQYYRNRPLVFELMQKEGILYLIVDEEIHKLNANVGIGTLTLNLTNSIDGKPTQCYGDAILLYNRALSRNEVKHNLNVLNNSPSLKSLETTATDGKKTTILWGSDTDHVENRTGYTLEESNTELLKAMSKEHISTTGADITVANGIGKQRVIGAEIQGQTVKNYIQTRKTYVFMGSNKYLAFQDVILEPNKRYKFSAFISDYVQGTSTEKRLLLQYKKQDDTNTGLLVLNQNLSQQGWLTETITVPSDYKSSISIYVTTQFLDGGGTFKIDKAVLYDEQYVVNDFFLGLQSTEATISNNGIKYPFYYLDAEGKKKQIFLPFAEDKLTLNSDGSLTGIKTYSEKIITGLDFSRDWGWSDNHVKIKLSIQATKVLCPTLSTITDVQWAGTGSNGDVEGIAIHSGEISIKIPKSKLNGYTDSLTSSEKAIIIKNYLDNSRFNILYSATPTTYTVDKSVNEPIATTDKINILSVDSPVSPSSFSITHYPTVKSIVNEMTMSELFNLGKLTQDFNTFDYAETDLNVCNTGYLSGGFINIPFSLIDNSYVRLTNSVKLYSDIKLVLVTSSAKEVVIPKDTANITLVTNNNHDFILRIPTSETGVGNVYVTDSAPLGVGLRKGNE